MAKKSKKRRRYVTTSVAAERLGVTVPTILRNCSKYNVGTAVYGSERTFMILNDLDIEMLRKVMQFRSGRPKKPKKGAEK